MRREAPFEVNFYYLLSAILILMMLVWFAVEILADLIFGTRHSITLGDLILFQLLIFICRYGRHIRRVFEGT